MAVLWCGGELDAFNPGGGGVEMTTAGFGTGYDTTYSRCCVRCGTANINHKVTSIDLASPITGTIWVHWYLMYDAINDITNPHMELHNSGGTQLFRISITSTASNIATMQCQYWNGSSWTNIGSTFTQGIQGAYAEYDLKVVCGGSGSMEIYQNKALVASGSASMTSVTSLVGAGWYNNRTSSTFGTMISQCIIADQSTVGWKMYTKPPTGNSATNTAWTDDYTKVDEAVLDDADYIASTTNGDVETFTWAGVTIPAGYAVVAVAVNARVRNDGSGPVNIQAALRRSSTNYFGSNVSMSGTAFTPTCTIWATDPSTGAAWTPSNAQSGSTEFGVKALT